MKEKPNFMNKNQKNKMFRQLSSYFNKRWGSESNEHIFTKEDMTKAVLTEELHQEFIENKD
jgi:hypothetical protein